MGGAAIPHVGSFATALIYINSHSCRVLIFFVRAVFLGLPPRLSDRAPVRSLTNRASLYCTKSSGRVIQIRIAIMDALRRTGETDSTRSSRYVQRPSVVAPPGKNTADNEGRKRPRRFTSGR
jgi:hypothetical protein